MIFPGRLLGICCWGGELGGAVEGGGEGRMGVALLDPAQHDHAGTWIAEDG